MELAFFDWLVVFIYLAIIASIGLYVSRGQRTVRKFFTADRSIPSWAVGFTLMATIVGSGTFVGHPGTAYGKGMILFLPHMLLPLVLLIVAVWIVPFYRRVVQMSAYEFVGRRFGLGSRIYTSLGFLADRIFDLGVTLVTTGIALYVFTGWEPMYVILGTGLFTLIYTMIGGITAVAWTNVAQGIILSGGAALILIRVLFAPEIGDPVGIIKSSWEAGRYSFGSWEFSWRMLFDRETTTIWIFFFAYFIQWSRRYITDQHIVQSYLIGESDKAASRGALMGAFCCLPIFFAFMFIGGSFYGFFDLMPGDAGPVKADEVMPYFLSRYIPAGGIGADFGRYPGGGHVLGERRSQQYRNRPDHRLLRKHLSQSKGENPSDMREAVRNAGGIIGLHHSDIAASEGWVGPPHGTGHNHCHHHIGGHPGFVLSGFSDPASYPHRGLLRYWGLCHIYLLGPFVQARRGGPTHRRFRVQLGNELHAHRPSSVTSFSLAWVT